MSPLVVSKMAAVDLAGANKINKRRQNTVVKFSRLLLYDDFFDFQKELNNFFINFFVPQDVSVNT
jgi:hypothetical protein